MTDKAAEVVITESEIAGLYHQTLGQSLREQDRQTVIRFGQAIAIVLGKELAASREREAQMEKELTNCSNFCQGMSLDPSTPKHARDALAYRITKIDAALHHTGAKQ